MDYSIESLPPSYSYGEIIQKINVNQIAYCYMGNKNKGIFIIKKKDGSIVQLLLDDHSDMIKDNYELWLFIHQTPNGIIRQNAVNRWFDVFSKYDKYLNLSTYNFQIE